MGGALHSLCILAQTLRRYGDAVSRVWANQAFGMWGGGDSNPRRWYHRINRCCCSDRPLRRPNKIFQIFGVAARAKRWETFPAVITVIIPVYPQVVAAKGAPDAL